MGQMKQLLSDYLHLISPELEDELMEAWSRGDINYVVNDVDFPDPLTPEIVLEHWKDTGKLVMPELPVIQRMLNEEKHEEKDKTNST